MLWLKECLTGLSSIPKWPWISHILSFSHTYKKEFFPLPKLAFLTFFFFKSYLNKKSKQIKHSKIKFLDRKENDCKKSGALNMFSINPYLLVQFIYIDLIIPGIA